MQKVSSSTDPFHHTSQEVPVTLAKAIELQTRGEMPTLPEGAPVPLSEEEYAALREKVLADIARECDKNPYHNRPHTEGVERRFLELAKLAGFSPCETQVGGIIALLHDYGHVGQISVKKHRRQYLGKI